LDAVSATTVKAHLERVSGRPIRLVPMVLRSAEPCGMCVTGDGEDFIVFNTAASPIHQDHIIAHELAHMVMGHVASKHLDRTTAELLFPDLGSAALRDLFTRAGSYSDPDEAEAEVLATLIQSTRHRQSLPKSTGMVGYLEAAFGRALSTEPNIRRSDPPDVNE
jgi:hypothetical protein